MPQIFSLLRGGMHPRARPRAPAGGHRIRDRLIRGWAAVHPRPADPAAPASSQAGRRKPSLPV